MRKIWIAHKRILSDPEFMSMHPAFRNVLWTAILIQENLSGVVRVPRKTFYHYLNESEHGGRDILEAFLKQYPDWLTYDDLTNELALLIWPNMTWHDLNAKSRNIMLKDIEEIRSEAILKEFCRVNHSSTNQPYLTRLRQLQIQRVNAKRSASRFIDSPPVEYVEDQEVTTKAIPGFSTNAPIYIPPVEYAEDQPVATKQNKIQPASEEAGRAFTDWKTAYTAICSFYAVNTPGGQCLNTDDQKVLKEYLLNLQEKGEWYKIQVPESFEQKWMWVHQIAAGVEKWQEYRKRTDELKFSKTKNQNNGRTEQPSIVSEQSARGARARLNNRKTII